MKCCGIHLLAILQKTLQFYILDISLKIPNLILQPHLPGVNELIHSGLETLYDIIDHCHHWLMHWLIDWAITWTNDASWILWHKLQWNLTGNTIVYFHGNALEMSSARWQPFCSGLKLLNVISIKSMRCIIIHFRADSRLAPSQWETSLQSNGISHWLGVNLESALHFNARF